MVDLNSSFNVIRRMKMEHSISSTILAMWNVLLVLLILYAPGLLSLFAAIRCIIRKKKIFGIILIIIAVLFLVISSVILYWALDWIFT